MRRVHAVLVYVYLAALTACLVLWVVTDGSAIAAVREYHVGTIWYGFCRALVPASAMTGLLFALWLKRRFRDPVRVASSRLALWLPVPTAGVMWAILASPIFAEMLLYGTPAGMLTAYRSALVQAAAVPLSLIAFWHIFCRDYASDAGPVSNPHPD